ncbi:site-specific integrase [Staphylococcus saprophyticus]|nr:site-specific integrase [Staphylococcus saprophyticus]MDW3965945.1 site-specific integrase [Staphylococcus saprophyticus]
MTVKKQGNKWRYDFVLNGKRYRKSGFTKKIDATIAMNDAFEKANKGFAQDDKTPFVKYFNSWIEVHKEPYLTPKSVKTYYNAKNVFEEHFGNLALKDLTKTKYQELINSYASTRTTESVRKLNYCLRSAIQDALHEGIIYKDPTYKVNIKGAVKEQPEEDKFMQLEYFYKLKEYAQSQNQLSYLFIYLAIVTGARFSEIQKMRYKDFDIENETVHIRGTKNVTSDRVIKISREDIKHVRQVLNDFPINLDGDIFRTGASLITHNAVSKVLQRFCLNNRIGNYTLHSIRHTHCSMLIHEGISIYYISKRLGHADITTTLSTYSHLLEESQKQEESKTLEALRHMR